MLIMMCYMVVNMQHLTEQYEQLELRYEELYEDLKDEMDEEVAGR